MAPIWSGRRADVAALLGLAAVSVMVVQPVASPQRPSIYGNTRYSFAERAADLVSRMTLREKVMQLHTNDAPAIGRLGVQQYTYWSEGQHGLSRLGGDSAAGRYGAVDIVHATSFPSNLAASMSWDPELMYAETTAISDEARGFLDKSLFGKGQHNIGRHASEYGDLTYWAPTVNMDRDPRWGRTDEGFGEDPYLVARMATAFVNGYQGNTMTGQPLTPYLKVAATAKHYALNNVETGRYTSDSVASEAELRQYYLAQFRHLIEDSHVSGLMTSYNSVNGTPSAVDTYTVNQLAQRTYGFDGYITSDCDAVASAFESPPKGHAWAAPGWKWSTVDGKPVWTRAGTTIPAAAGAEAYALRAGTGLNCGGGQASQANIDAAIRAGLLSEAVIDTALVRVFTMRMATGEFDPPASNPYTRITKAAIESPAHQRLARTAADESLVLVQNSAVAGTSVPLLPVEPAALKHVVILGNLADRATLGSYSGTPTVRISAVQGLTEALRAANPGATLLFDGADTSTTATAPAVLGEATKAAIRAADLVVLFVGTDINTGHEDFDRASLALPGNLSSLVDQVTALDNPRTALVIQSSGPVAIEGVRSRVPAILFSAYNGQSQGEALADVLFGAQNPDGHLNFTWYRDDSQLPAMANYALSPAGTGGLGRTYQYFTGTPTYPFGYGLSYTTFRTSGASTDRTLVTADGTVAVELDVTNTGTRNGSTVAQLYVSPPDAGSGEIPRARLAGFQKTRVLQPGQTQHLTLNVRVSDLARWDTARSREDVANGVYRFQLGTDASTMVAGTDVTVTGPLTPRVRHVTVQPEAVIYRPGETVDLTGRNRWLADDTGRDRGIRADRIVEAVNTDQSFVDLAWAHVGYASSDPKVVSVDGHGQLRALREGVATITVTVDGVSGTAVIVVRRRAVRQDGEVVAGKPATNGPFPFGLVVDQTLEYTRAERRLPEGSVNYRDRVDPGR
jgi:beta-glucosidase-like glycosyl hydrolase